MCRGAKKSAAVAAQEKFLAAAVVARNLIVCCGGRGASKFFCCGAGKYTPTVHFWPNWMHVTFSCVYLIMYLIAYLIGGDATNHLNVWNAKNCIGDSVEELFPCAITQEKIFLKIGRQKHAKMHVVRSTKMQIVQLAYLPPVLSPAFLTFCQHRQ